MALRLSDLVISGEFHNTIQYCVHGCIVLRGSETPIHVELTGSPAEDLRGRSFEFEAPENDTPPTEEDIKLVAQFADQQIGATGTISAADMVKTFDCPVEEYLRRVDMGDPPPVRLARRLYIEWFSQNGRVVIELADPKLKFLDGREAPPAVDSLDLQSENPASESGPQILTVSPDDVIDPLDPLGSVGEVYTEAEDEDEYGLFPKDLNRDLERAAQRTDREMSGDSDKAASSMEEWERFDDLIEHGVGTPVGELIEGLKLPAPSESLTEEQCEVALLSALTQLALFGTAFHICEHCSMCDAYRIFMEHVCKESTVSPQMRGTSFVQHYTTSDFCRTCQA